MTRIRTRRVGAGKGRGKPTGARGAGLGELRSWWNGRGTRKGKRVAIAWGAPGSYRACLAKAAGKVPPNQVHGFCANRYFEATGRWPGRRGKK